MATFIKPTSFYLIINKYPYNEFGVETFIVAVSPPLYALPFTAPVDSTGWTFIEG